MTRSDCLRAVEKLPAAIGRCNKHLSNLRAARNRSQDLTAVVDDRCKILCWQTASLVSQARTARLQMDDWLAGAVQNHSSGAAAALRQFSLEPDSAVEAHLLRSGSCSHFCSPQCRCAVCEWAQAAAEAYWKLASKCFDECSRPQYPCHRTRETGLVQKCVFYICLAHAAASYFRIKSATATSDVHQVTIIQAMLATGEITTLWPSESTQQRPDASVQGPASSASDRPPASTCQSTGSNWDESIWGRNRFGKPMVPLSRLDSLRRNMSISSYGHSAHLSDSVLATCSGAVTTVAFEHADPDSQPLADSLPLTRTFVEM